MFDRKGRHVIDDVATCPACGKIKRVNDDRTIAPHFAADSDTRLCRGVGQEGRS
jgi:hypothetical protein